jgi:hypothetical protein
MDDNFKADFSHLLVAATAPCAFPIIFFLQQTGLNGEELQ